MGAVKVVVQAILAGKLSQEAAAALAYLEHVDASERIHFAERLAGTSKLHSKELSNVQAACLYDVARTLHATCVSYVHDTTRAAAPSLQGRGTHLPMSSDGHGGASAATASVRMSRTTDDDNAPSATSAPGTPHSESGASHASGSTAAAAAHAAMRARDDDAYGGRVHRALGVFADMVSTYCTSMHMGLERALSAFCGEYGHYDAAFRESLLLWWLDNDARSLMLSLQQLVARTPKHLFMMLNAHIDAPESRHGALLALGHIVCTPHCPAAVVTDTPLWDTLMDVLRVEEEEEVLAAAVWDVVALVPMLMESVVHYVPELLDTVERLLGMCGAQLDVHTPPPLHAAFLALFACLYNLLPHSVMRFSRDSCAAHPDLQRAWAHLLGALRLAPALLLDADESAELDAAAWHELSTSEIVTRCARPVYVDDRGDVRGVGVGATLALHAPLAAVWRTMVGEERARALSSPPLPSERSSRSSSQLNVASLASTDHASGGLPPVSTSPRNMIALAASESDAASTTGSDRTAASDGPRQRRVYSGSDTGGGGGGGGGSALPPPPPVLVRQNSSESTGTVQSRSSLTDMVRWIRKSEPSTPTTTAPPPAATRLPWEESSALASLGADSSRIEMNRVDLRAHATAVSLRLRVQQLRVRVAYERNLCRHTLKTVSVLRKRVGELEEGEMDHRAVKIEALRQEDVLGELRQTIIEQRKEITDQQRKFQVYEDALQARLRKSTHQYRTIREHIQELDVQSAQGKQENAAMKAELHAATDELVRLRKENAYLREVAQRVEGVEGEQTRLREEVQLWEMYHRHTQHRTQQSASSEMADRLAQVEQQLVVAQEKMNLLQVELQMRKDEATVLKNTIAERERVVQQLRETLAEHKRISAQDYRELERRYRGVVQGASES